MKKLKIAVIYGSYRSDRMGIRAAKFCLNQLEGKCETVFLDAKEIDLPILDKMFKEYPGGEAPENMRKASEALSSSDAYVIITLAHPTPMSSLQGSIIIASNPV